MMERTRGYVKACACERATATSGRAVMDARPDAAGGLHLSATFHPGPVRDACDTPWRQVEGEWPERFEVDAGAPNSPMETLPWPRPKPPFPPQPLPGPMVWTVWFAKDREQHDGYKGGPVWAGIYATIEDGKSDLQRETEAKGMTLDEWAEWDTRGEGGIGPEAVTMRSDGAFFRLTPEVLHGGLPVVYVIQFNTLADEHRLVGVCTSLAEVVRMVREATEYDDAGAVRDVDGSSMHGFVVTEHGSYVIFKYRPDGGPLEVTREELRELGDRLQV
jgi:hypothetical protein